MPWKREAESAQLLGGLELVEASKREDLGLALQRKSELQTNLVLCKSSEPEREKGKEIECITSFSCAHDTNLIYFHSHELYFLTTLEFDHKSSSFSR